MYRFRNLKDVDLSGRRVLLRVALDVPIKNGVVLEDYRIRAILPTLKYLLQKNCRVAILTWLGRPDGKVVEKYRLDPVAKVLSKVLSQPVKKVDDCIGPQVQRALFELQPGEVLLLENVRFHHEEMIADQGFAAELARGFDLEVFDAFAQSHRVHASTTGLLKILPAVAGFGLQKEVQTLENVVGGAKHPRLLIVGGAKVSDKIKLISQLINQVDKVLVGGVCANVFLKARGGEPLGHSFLSDVFVNQAKGHGGNYLTIAKTLLRRYHDKIVLPLDLRAAASDSGKVSKVINLATQDIDPAWAYYDIGPKTIALFESEIKKAKTILWNGPMGLYETQKFATGTMRLTKAIAASKAVTIAGGGDSEEIIGHLKLINKFTHVSTGGGAMLEFLSGQKLPALEALKTNQSYFRANRKPILPLAEFNQHNNPYYRQPFLNLETMLAPAVKYRFGVPALNIRSKYILDAVLQAAFAERSPVILEIAESEMAYCHIFPERLVNLVLERLSKLEKKYGYIVPITIHADHVKKDIGVADAAVRAGFSSVAIDQSAKPLEQNAAIVADFVRRAHPLGVTVEGEIGEVGEAKAQKANVTTRELLRYAPMPEQALKFVSQTGIDAFAGFFGNYHGRDLPNSTIVWGRMKQVAKAIRQAGYHVPLVLHGSSYLQPKGYTAVNVYHQAIKCGCHKFNYATVLSDIFARHLPTKLLNKMAAVSEDGESWKKELGDFEKEIDRLDKKILKAGVADVQAHVQMMMRQAWRCSGKAKYYHRPKGKTSLFALPLRAFYFLVSPKGKEVKIKD